MQLATFAPEVGQVFKTKNGGWRKQNRAEENARALKADVDMLQSYLNVDLILVITKIIVKEA